MIGEGPRCDLGSESRLHLPPPNSALHPTLAALARVSARVVGQTKVFGPMPSAEWVVMECGRQNFKPVAGVDVRWLTLDDDFDFVRTAWVEDPSFRRRDWDRLHGEGYTFCVVSDVGTVLSRAAVWRRSEEEWEVEAVWTRADCRRRGLAKAVVSTATASVLENDRIATLHALAENVAMVRVAESVGFRPRGAE